MKNSYWYPLIIALICCLLLSALIAQPSAGLRVEGSLLKASVNPGETITHSMKISIQETEQAQDVLIDIVGFGQRLDTTYQMLDASKDTSPYSARNFITLDKTSLHLEPGSSDTLVATIRIPENVGPGGRYALIYIHTIAKGQGTTSFAAAVLVPIYLTITNLGILRTGTITDINVSEATRGQPIIIGTTLRNTGNHHYPNTVNEVIVKDMAGNKITNTTTVLNISIIPTFSVQYKAQVSESLPIGNYIVTSRVSLDDGTVLDEKTTTFEVKKAYVPPFFEVSTTLSPGSTGLLTTSDGKISINFPTGAVLDTTTVTLKPVLPSQLPQAPAGAKHAVTSFSVEGLTGLLSKDATLTVKYSADDLAVAGGDANKLVLARWDKGENKWTLILTTVNQGAGTLTVTTNRFSTWVIMVSEGAVPGTSPGITKTDGFTFGIASGALALLVITMGLHRKR